MSRNEAIDSMGPAQVADLMEHGGIGLEDVVPLHTRAIVLLRRLAQQQAASRYCDACEQMVSEPCNSADCPTPERENSHD